MSEAGERINAILDDLLIPCTGDEEESTSRVIVGGGAHLYVVDLAALSPVVMELIDLLYLHPRDQHEVSYERLLVLGMAIGALANVRKAAGKPAFPEVGELL